MSSLLDKSSYFYDLPEELIAQSPVEPRDSSRLLVFNRQEKNIEHKKFKDIIDYLQPGDILVVNNTKVLPARLLGIKQDMTGRATWCIPRGVLLYAGHDTLSGV